jgi:serine/threonine protein phosphatase PrpC
MKIELFSPLSIFARGKRDNMEDCIFPGYGLAKDSDTFFIVCDGMGGHNRGETASNLACQGFSEYFSDNPYPGNPEHYFRDAFDYVEGLFDLYTDQHKETRGMGTTLVMIYFINDTAVVMHCGDSRCYHFRGNELAWRTRDHKLVEEWVSQGLISAQEAAKHPKSNMITRAIQGFNTLKVEPDINIISDIKPGDYFFLCSDGIYESISDSQLGEILASGSSDTEKIQIIEELCSGNSKDNYSAYMLKIKNLV